MRRRSSASRTPTKRARHGREWVERSLTARMREQDVLGLESWLGRSLRRGFCALISPESSTFALPAPVLKLRECHCGFGARCSVRLRGACQIDDGEGFEHADPAALAFVARDYQAKRALVGTQRLPVGGVGDQDSFGSEIFVEFCEGEYGALAVGAFGDDRQRHAFAAQSRALRNACFGEQCSDGYAVVLMNLVVVAFGANRFAGEFLEVIET